MPKRTEPPRDRSNDQLLTSTEAALILRRSPGTLVDWRADGRGPTYLRDEHTGRVWYWRSDVYAWLEAQSAHAE